MLLWARLAIAGNRLSYVIQPCVHTHVHLHLKRVLSPFPLSLSHLLALLLSSQPPSHPPLPLHSPSLLSCPLMALVLPHPLCVTGVGKTSLVHLILNGHPTAQPPRTVGCSVGVKYMEYSPQAEPEPGDSTSHLRTDPSSSSVSSGVAAVGSGGGGGEEGRRGFFVEVWDVSGSEQYKSSRSLFYDQINDIRSAPGQGPRAATTGPGQAAAHPIVLLMLHRLPLPFPSFHPSPPLHRLPSPPALHPLPGVIFVHDLSRKKSRVAALQWMDELVRSGTFSAPSHGHREGQLPVPLLVIGNKDDLRDKDPVLQLQGRVKLLRAARSSRALEYAVRHAKTVVERYGLRSFGRRKRGELPEYIRNPRGAGLIACAKQGRLDLAAVDAFFLQVSPDPVTGEVSPDPVTAVVAAAGVAAKGAKQGRLDLAAVDAFFLQVR
ncbi:unnamed protein product [Closterium sp. Yama58-4]|nr:unnamed protein product [Closterium sp. Yama58-4]